MKSSFEEMGATWRKEGDHCLPNLVASDAPVWGIWGQQRRGAVRQIVQADDRI